MLKKTLKHNHESSSWKLHILPVLCIAFIASLLLFSKVAVNSAIKGIDLWLNVVFPCIFPFLVASEILSSTNFIKAVGVILEPVMQPIFNAPGCASFPLALGITSGYPVGAKVITSMKENKLISCKVAERLLAFCNNSSPLFIMGAVSVGMLKMPQTGALLLICHIAAGISVGIIYKFHNYDKKKKSTSTFSNYFRTKKIPDNTSANISANINPLTDLGNLLTNAVKNAVTSLLTIGGFIIIFSVIINLLIETGIIEVLINLFYPVLKYTRLPKEFFVCLSSGFIEITTGLKMLSSLENISFNVRLTAVSAILGWGGISVHMQIYSIINNSKLSIKPYLIGKLMQSVISAFYTLLALKVMGKISQPTASIFGYFSINTRELTTWYQYFLNSCKHLTILILFFLFLIIIAIIMSLIKHFLEKLYKYKL
ncbi:MAG: sporulation integral membrane protein YlbJ [Clostridiaceae bacterium]|jgi:sporulation integral membrane protein YlbJ|nr:sporulation integral membrane protein YlbJ [Clostridiaceae bacterium]